MEAYNFKIDLDTFPNSNIKSLARYYGLRADSMNDLRWLIALKHASDSTSPKGTMIGAASFEEMDDIRKLLEIAGNNAPREMFSEEAVSCAADFVREAEIKVGDLVKGRTIMLRERPEELPGYVEEADTVIFKKPFQEAFRRAWYPPHPLYELTCLRDHPDLHVIVKSISDMLDRT